MHDVREKKPSEGLRFGLDEDTDTYVVKGIGTCTDTDIVIPSTYNGKAVTSIDWYAFWDCTSLTSITLPFVGATKDGTGNTYFGYIFGAWSGYDNDDYVPSSLKTVIITGGTSIGEDAFYGCSSLTSITIPDSVTSIGGSAFSGCSGFMSITIPNSVASIGNRSFRGCSRLTSITIPDSVTSIGEDAFYGCSSLEYNIYDNAKYLGNENNPYVVLVEATGTDITSCQIHENTKVIYGSAFWGCSSLVSITIPDSVTSIGEWAFRYCSSLTDINYSGTKAEWKAISKGWGWNDDTGEYTVHCSDGDI